MKTSFTRCFFFFFAFSGLHAQAPAHLRWEHRDNPMGIGTDVPRLSWEIPFAQQSAYQIRTTADSNDLTRGRKLRWDSGKKTGSQNVLVTYGGPALRPAERTYWQVRVWDARGKPSAWSPVAFWETGRTDLGTAQWITAPWHEDSTVTQPCAMFRNAFTIKGKVVRARLYVTAHGLYQLHLNGAVVGNDRFAPGWTSYNNRLQVQAYDITHQIRQGENVVGAVLGDGWYRGYIGWITQRNFYGSKLALLLELEITYADGRVQKVVSDNNWKGAKGPILAADIYNGIVYDARLEQPDWATPGFAARDWQTVKTLPASPKNMLVPQEGLPVSATQIVGVKQFFKTPKGEWVCDFGQNLVGHVRFRVQGKAGDTIVVHHAEVLDAEGNFYKANLRKARAEIRYILRGDKDGEIFEPLFTFMGFRYIRISGVENLPESVVVEAIVVHSDMEQTGSFACSDSLINRLQQNIQWGQRGNFLDVPTDCPQRDERMGWTGDAQAFAPTAAFNYDVAAFFTKWLRDMRADQLPDGRIPYVVPNVLRARDAASAGWADAVTIIPWTLFESYGDTAVLRENYPAMKKWVDYQTQSAGPDTLWNTGFHFGDWVFYSLQDDTGGRSAVTDKYLIAQAFWARSADLLRRSAQVLDYKEDAQQYTLLFESIKTAFQREYMTPSGRLASNTQTAYVLALAFDVLPESARPQAAKRLANNILDYGHLTTGFLGTPLLCPVLSGWGYDSLAYALLERKKYPSWLYPVTKGATTIWERWDGIKPDGTFQNTGMNSFNHYAYGAIGHWMYSRVAGLGQAPGSVGYKRLLLQPTPGGTLTWANASLRTPNGMAESGWGKTAAGLHITATVPSGSTARLRLPGAVGKTVLENGKVVESGRLEKEAGNMWVELGPGVYVFEY